MKKFLIAIAAVGFMSLPVMADERPRRERDNDRDENNRRDDNHRHRHGRSRGFAFNYYSPGDVFGGIGNYGVGVSARVGRGVLDIVAAPFATAPVMGPPRTYMYHPSTIEYTRPFIHRIYPRRRHRHWHRH